MEATGLILGKFLPPHAGHLHLVAAARARVRRLTVVVCSIAREPIAGPLRYAWMRELCPDANVVHLDEELPQEPREHPRFWELWTEALRRFEPAPDLVFTSEDYGDELGRRLGARHVLVDRERRANPVSGTAVRADPLGQWHHLPPPVRAHYARRVAIVGPESTGKTTLAAALAERFGTVWVPEFARAHLDPKGGKCAEEDIALIARGQVSDEDRLARDCNRVLFCDTDTLTTTIWSEHLFGGCPAWIHELAARRRYDLTLLLDIDVPWVPDGQRDQGHARERERFRDHFRRVMAPRNPVEISGGWDERLRAAVEAVEPLLHG